MANMIIRFMTSEPTLLASYKANGSTSRRGLF
jgi:hypothetical protein